MADKTRARVRVLTTVAAIALIGLTGQLGNLTLRQQVAFAANASEEQTRELPEPAPRGTIYDRNMVPLATNRPAYTVYLTYPYLDRTDVLETLSTILNVPETKLADKVKQQADRPYAPVALAANIGSEQYAKIAEQRQALPGVQVQSEPVREYPQGPLAAHVLGYVIGSGQTGLEAKYDSRLAGVPGAREVEVNNLFEPVAAKETRPPTPGMNLVLTIDANLQHTAERALDWQMQRLQTIPNLGDGHAYPNAKAGAAVVIDVRTGAILAMASRPAYDPNMFVGGIAQTDWSKLNNDPLQPLLNRAIQSAYQPGSTWKLMTGGTALTDGVTTPYEKVFSGAKYEPTGQHDWVPGGHGWVDLPNALRLSSDIYFYEMGRRLGIERLVAGAQAFGFGSPTGIDLDGETTGFLPDQAFRDKNGWWLGQTTSAAIGQIFTVTPIQLARYAAALANGGKLLQPYLVSEVRAPGGAVVQQTQPKQTGSLPVSAETLQVLVQGMKLVNSPTGTSDFAQWPLPGIATAGKTGTAENPPKDDYGLFISFAPADKPEIAIATVIEQAGHGGSVSPVARSIYAQYFGVKLPNGDPARIPDDFEP